MRVCGVGVRVYRGTSLIRNPRPPRIAAGPYAESYYRFMGMVGFSWARYPCT